MPIAEKLLSEFDEEFAGTRKVLALVPDEKLGWKPHEKSMDMARLAWHLADFPEWCTETLTRDVFEVRPEDGARRGQERIGTKRADMLAKFDRDLPEARAALARTADSEMARHWKMTWSGQTVIDSPRQEVLRKWVLNHMVHHRAQMAVYLRMNGIPIPGLYGPSADETGG